MNHRPAPNIPLGPQSKHQLLVSFGVSLLASVLALLLSIVATRYSDSPVFAFFVLAPVVTAWFWGTFAGVLTMLFSFAEAWYFMLDPQYSFGKSHPAQFVRLCTQWLVAGVLVYVVSRLSASERRDNELRAIIESSQDAIIGKKLDGTITSWNRGAEHLFGYTAAEIVGRSISTLIPPEKQDQLEEILKGLARGERFERFETTRRRKDGTTVEVVVSISPIRDYSGKVMGASSIVHDVTDRRRIDRVLTEKARLLDLSSDAILVRDKSDRITYWNDGAADLYGYTRTEALGRISQELLKTEHPEPLESIVSKVYSEGRWFGELVHTRKDGTKIVVSSRWSLGRDASGEPVSVLETNTNITERKQAEEALRQSEIRFRALAENIPQMIWVADAAASFIYLSPRWLEYTGTTFEQNANAAWTDALHPEDRDAAIEKWKNAVLSRSVYEAEYRVRRADGVYRWHLARAVPSHSNAERTLWFGTTTDIEDQKRAQEVLIRSEKLASAGRMAATVAHEVNNPLEIVVNSIFIASLDPNLSDQTRASLATADQELRRIAQLTRQTLGFYRENTAPIDFNLDRLVSDLLNLYSTKFVQRDVSLEKLDGSDLIVRGVEGEIRQVISNILSNAIDACPHGQIRVRTSRVTLDRVGYIRLTIADTGMGIAPENLRRIFEPFFTTKQTYGTGLGLWVSKEIVRRHHGRIRVRSSPGRGTAFSVFLPAGSAAKNRKPAADSSRATQPVRGHTAHF